MLATLPCWTLACKKKDLPLIAATQLWASGYEIYDRLSPAMQTFLEGLTAIHDATFFHDEARRLGNPLREGIRGSPLNRGSELKAIHPVIRTNRELRLPFILAEVV